MITILTRSDLPKDEQTRSFGQVKLADFRHLALVEENSNAIIFIEKSAIRESEFHYKILKNRFGVLYETVSAQRGTLREHLQIIVDENLR